MKKVRRPELLVPAGSIEPFIAAVENGADAVYIGGRLFNARMNAGNFDDEILPQALDYAHARGVKVFVTMNTLIYDEEMEEALEYADFLYEVGVDALIIQDLGLGKRIHESLPEFPLHLSTQGTAFDADCVRVASKLGYERVVLSRELSLSEIEKVCEETDADIEMFVHGALCICYSGQCQMSRFYGGRSGNRGACAQPCRLPYVGRTLDGKKSSGHLLSPRDLCLIDNLGALIEAGVYSFKIEGRMKSPEYVAVVTRIYRKYIDEYMEKGTYRVSEEDRQELMQIFNRGGFTAGYLQGNPGKKLMSKKIPKNQGIRIGTVTSVRKGSTLVDVRCDIEPNMGDGIEIRSMVSGSSAASQNARTASNIISYKKALGNGVWRIGDFKESVSKGDIVYRTSAKDQLEEARQSFRHISLPDIPETVEGNGGKRHIGRRRGISLTLTCFHQILRLTASTLPEEGEQWMSQQVRSVTVEAGPYDVDGERATPEERFRNALLKTGSTPFRVEKLNLKGDFDVRVRASEINALRRDCLAALEKEIVFRRELPSIPGMELPSKDELARILPKSIHRIPLAELCLEAEERTCSLQEVCSEYDLASAEAFAMKPECEEATTDAGLKHSLEETQMNILSISNVTKGLEDEILLRHMTEITAIETDTPILVGNLSWLSRLLLAGNTVYADYGLNALNRESVQVLTELGVTGYFPSLEAMEREDFLAGEELPLMVSEHDFDAVEIENKKRRIQAELHHPRYSSQTRVLPK